MCTNRTVAPGPPDDKGVNAGRQAVVRLVWDRRYMKCGSLLRDYGVGCISRETSAPASWWSDKMHVVAENICAKQKSYGLHQQALHHQTRKLQSLESFILEC